MFNIFKRKRKRKNKINVPDYLKFIEDEEYYGDVKRLINDVTNRKINELSKILYKFYNNQKEKKSNYTMKEFIFLVKVLIENSSWRMGMKSRNILVLICKFIDDKRITDVFEIFNIINFKEDLSKQDFYNTTFIYEIIRSENVNLIKEFFEKYNREFRERFLFINMENNPYWSSQLLTFEKLFEYDFIDSKYFKICFESLIELVKTDTHWLEIFKKTFKDFKFFWDNEITTEYIINKFFRAYKIKNQKDVENLKIILKILFKYREKPKILKDIDIRYSANIKILSDIGIKIDIETLEKCILEDPIEFIDYINNIEILIKILNGYYTHKEQKELIIKKCGNIFFNNYEMFKKYIKEEDSQNLLLTIILYYGEKIKDEEFLNIFYFVDNSNKEKIIKTFQQRFRNLFLIIIKNNIEQNNLKELIKLLLLCKPSMGIAVEMAEIVDIHRVELLETVIKLYFPYIINDINSEYSERLKKLLKRVMIYNECKNSNFTALIK